MQNPSKFASDQALEAVIEKVVSDLTGEGSFSALRAAAREKFSLEGLPNRRVEEWRYSDMKRAMPADLTLAEPLVSQDIIEALLAEPVLADLKRARIVLVNGVYRPDLSRLDALEDIVTVRSVAEALKAGDFVLDDPEIVRDDPALSLNTALMQDGVIITLAEGAQPDMPVEICSLMSGGGLASLRNRLVVAKGASLDVIETFIGDNQVYQVNAAMDYRLEEGSKLRVLRLLQDGEKGLHLGSTTARLQGDVNFEHFTFLTGGHFVRSQSFVSLEGEYSNADLFGISMLSGEQHGDITLHVDHKVPNCNSKEQYRTVLDDSAVGVFQGQIIVRQNAQKTDGQMMSQALMLSEGCVFNNKPELEIYADDVVCGHGATCGELDEDLLFYMRARGIPEDEARKLLVLVFLSEAIEAFSNETFVKALEADLAIRMGLELEQ